MNRYRLPFLTSRFDSNCLRSSKLKALNRAADNTQGMIRLCPVLRLTG
jgi:hypothetical protein